MKETQNQPSKRSTYWTIGLSLLNLYFLLAPFVLPQWQWSYDPKAEALSHIILYGSLLPLFPFVNFKLKKKYQKLPSILVWLGCWLTITLTMSMLGLIR